MPEILTLAIPATETPQYAGDRLTPIVWSATLTSGIAASADTIRVATLPPNARIVTAEFRVDASAGTGATLQLRHNGTAITGATTAGGADSELRTAIVAPATSSTIVDLLVGTSAVTASCNVQATLTYVV